METGWRGCWRAGNLCQVWSRDPFLRPSSGRYDDILADAVVELLRERGGDAVSMRALAGILQVTPSGMSHRARWPETVCLIAEGIGRRWLQWSIRGISAGPVLRLPPLPVTMAERHGVRAWWVVTEMARTEAAAGRPEAQLIVDWLLDAEEVAMVQWWADCGRRGVDLDEFRVLSGLRLALARDPSLSLWRATGLLERLAGPWAGRWSAGAGGLGLDGVGADEG